MKREMAKAQKAASWDVRVDWSGAQKEPVQPVNVFAAQATPDFHVLNIGFVAPPVVVDEEDVRRAQRSRNVPPDIVARVLLTPEHMNQLVKVLLDNIASREKIVKSERGQ